jgi:hypothetical protein
MADRYVHLLNGIGAQRCKALRDIEAVEPGSPLLLRARRSPPSPPLKSELVILLA